MGQWNGTCAITQLPIMPGEKVSFVFIEQNKKEIDGSGVCYPESLFYIASPVMTGVYDGYGVFLDIDMTDSVSKFEETFFGLLKKGVLLIREEPYERTVGDGIYYAVRAVERELVECRNGLRIGVMMFKASALDYIMKDRPAYARERLLYPGLILKTLQDKYGLSTDELEDVNMLDIAMNRLNKLIGPQAGKGGQAFFDDDFERYAKYILGEVERLRICDDECF